MSDENTNAMPEIGFGEIITFLKKYCGRIIIFGLISVLVTAAIIGAAFFLLPKKEIYTSKINLLLQEKGKKLIYPSEKEFSANDIISIPVLRKVYENNKLNAKLKFDDFCQLFYLSGESMEKALLAASFKEKLNNKKLTVVELREIEREYEAALKNLDSSSVEIAMKPSFKFNRLEAVKLLNDIPAAWFAIFSRQEAKALPRFESVKQIKSLRETAAADGWLVTLDKARLACRNFQKGCEEMGEILAGQKVALPSGEYLEDLQEQLTSLEKNRISTVMMLVLTTPAWQTPLDKIFLQANVKELERQAAVEKSLYEANVAAINILHPTAAEGSKSAAAAAGKDSSLTMNFDSNFFTSVSTLIRSSSSIRLRETYAQKALDCKEKLAALEAEKSYYSAMLKEMELPPSAALQIPQERFNKISGAMFDELLTLCAKTNEFRELVLKDYLLDKQFFTSTGEVLRNAQFYIPFKRVAAGLILLCIVLNLCCIGSRFYTALNKGELKK